MRLLLNQPDEILQTKICLLVDFFWNMSWLIIIIDSVVYITWSVLLLLILIADIHKLNKQTLIYFNLIYAIILMIRELFQFDPRFYRYFYLDEISDANSKNKNKKSTKTLNKKEKIYHFIMFPFWYLNFFQVHF